MKLRFLGTGEAFSGHRSNTSILINNRLLLDCGYSIPQRIWFSEIDGNNIDYVFITHFHADHIGGLPMILMRFRQEKRSKPLTIIGPIGLKDYFKKLFELCYKGFLSTLPFDINYVEVSEGQMMAIGDMVLNFTNANHLEGEQKVDVISIKITSAGKSFCYSSDTCYSEKVVDLAKGCDLLVHESYLPHDSEYHKKTKAHSSPREAANAARLSNVKKLALVHLHRDFVKDPSHILESITGLFPGEIFIPNDGDIIEL